MLRLTLAVALVIAFLQGCATVPMAPVEEDASLKKFEPPSTGNSGIYIYRNSTFGGALQKSVYIDGVHIGNTGPMTYFYIEVPPGDHILSTQSEFGNNDLQIYTEEGKNYFARQYIKMGVLVGGANLEQVDETVGKIGVLECKLAKMSGQILVERKLQSDNAAKTLAATTVSTSAGGNKDRYEYYGDAEAEVVSGNYDKDLWARALVEVEGDEAKRKARYIELRAAQLYDKTTASMQGTASNSARDTSVAASKVNRYSGVFASLVSGRQEGYLITTDRQLRLVQDGNKVTGKLGNRVQLWGEVAGTSIRFEYVNPKGQRGSGNWNFNLEGTEATGIWKFRRRWNSSVFDTGEWNLMRIK